MQRRLINGLPGRPREAGEGEGVVGELGVLGYGQCAGAEKVSKEFPGALGVAGEDRVEV